MTTVTLGGRDVDVRPLSMGKGFILSDLVGQASGLWSSLDEEARAWQRTESEARALTFNQAEAEAVERRRRIAADAGGEPYEPLVPEGWDWQASPTFSIPQWPDWREAMARFIPRVWKDARPQVTRLLGLIAVDDAALWAAEDDGGDQAVDALLDRIGRDVSRTSSIPDVAAALIALAQLHLDEMQGAWGNLNALRGISPEGKPTNGTSATADGSPVPTSSRASRRSSARRKPSGPTAGGRG
jgi:hypothetical protein